ncbi:rhodanese-like domain-containing protein [Vibrio sp. DW001]|uniref:rhodanese-like domain-containing protein n=1 Tax=Vibrio sp. DW001 TaxID=2912315 RepID=UPI0023AFFB2A|nr:rhodanese-like domain-containing protein [Vibrio sp. DW001]WED29932.1 rhodanese-like domain-containing protein [Vibrio sp. DW001]
MKKEITVIFKKIVALALAFIAFSSFAENRAELAWQKIEQGALIVDVRTPQEFDTQHIESAVNFPLETVNVAFNNVDKDQQIVVYCRSGNRSGQAERFLKKNGFTNVHNGGGLNEMLASK